MTEEDRVGVPQHAEQRAAAAAVVGGPLDQAGDLHELDEHAAEPRRRRDGPRRGERVVAGADLDRRESLQQRGLARVRRPDERDLRRALAPHGDRVAMHDLLARARRRQLALDPLPQVGVRAVPVAGQVGEDRAKLADPFGTVLAHEAALDQLLLGAMWHRHRDVHLRCRGGTRRVPPLP